MVKLFCCLIFAYLLGSIPFGLIISKYFYKVDVRKYGSGNIGATNVWRSIGLIPGLIVLFFDAFKGFIPVFFVKRFLFIPHIPPGLPEILVSIIVIMGHNFPVFLKFKGGKGVAASLGVFIALDYRLALAGLVVFIIVVFVSRFISLGSISGTSTGPLMVLFLYRGKPEFYTYMAFT